VYTSVPVSLEPGEKIILRFSLATAATAADAISAARRTLKRGLGSGVPDEAAQMLELTPSEREEVFDWISATVYRGKDQNRECVPPLGKEGLWASGISGDLPLLLAEALDNAQWERVSRVVRQHRWLKMCGFSCDLAILLRDGGDYRRPAKTLLMEILKACRAEHTLGRKGGVHAVDLETLRPGQEALIKAFASARVPLMPSDGEADDSNRPAVYRADAHVLRADCALPVKTIWRPDGAFAFEIRGKLPPLAWSHTLANRNFSALVTETGAGYIAFQNARENKYTPWTNDPLAIDGGTTLTVCVNGARIKPFAADDGIPCGVTYGFGYARWEKRTDDLCIITTQFVPSDRNGLVTMVEAAGAAGFEITMETTPVMGVSPEDGRLCVVQTDEDGLVRIKNPLNTLYAPQTFTIAGTGNPAAQRGRLGRLTVTLEGKGRAVLVMGAARNEQGISLLRELTDWDTAAVAMERTLAYWRAAVKPVEVRSGSAALDRYGNGWALYQVVATRLFSRASQYQCGGAYGFRDQLQVVCARRSCVPARTNMKKGTQCTGGTRLIRSGVFQIRVCVPAVRTICSGSPM
jgi:cyclic beta-1,2-glucan synthetase